MVKENLKRIEEDHAKQINQLFTEIVGLKAEIKLLEQEDKAVLKEVNDSYKETNNEISRVREKLGELKSLFKS